MVPLKQIVPETLVPSNRIDAIIAFCEKVAHLPGECAELGVYKGGTAWVIAQALPNKRLYLFDTFTGIPFKGQHDKHQRGDFSDTSGHQVAAFFQDNPQVRICQGLFPETAALVPQEEKFAIVHLDADQYQSTKDGLEFFYPRMVEGGMIICDDYLWHMCPGVDRALFEFFKDKPERVHRSTDYQAVITKLPSPL